MGPARLKYLEMIQAVVTRMATNQFTTRAWSVTLGTAVVGWAVAKSDHPEHAIVAVLPTFCFWILDAFYLSHERSFRCLFNRQCQIVDEPASLSLETTWKPLDWIGALFSPAVTLVHGSVLLAAWLVWRGKWPL